MKKSNDIPGYLKLNLIIVAISLATCFGLSIGYSILSESLKVESIISVSKTSDIRLIELSTLISEDGAYEINNAELTRSTLAVNAGLPSLTSTASYTFKIHNYGETTMMVKSINMSANTNELVTYDINNLKLNYDAFLTDDEIEYTITFKYLDTQTTLPVNTEFNCLLEFEFTEYIKPEEDYIKESIILNLKGTDVPVNDNWVDQENNKTIKLNSVIYNETDKSYDFSTTNAYGTYGQPLIPTTGDFTLETYIKIPNSYPTDAAIISQVSDTSNDSGRFKLNLYGGVIRVFYNQQYPTSTNLYPIVMDNVFLNSLYLLQLVRKGDSLHVYINNQLLLTTSYLSSNTLSTGPFKLGKWNNSTVQQFAGKYYSVRLYNRALDDDELNTNATLDFKKYGNPLEYDKQYPTLIEYAENVQMLTSLYTDNINNKVYRGSDANNYLKIGDTNNTFRILGYTPDGLMKVVDITQKYNVKFDEVDNRVSSTSTYCTMSESSPAGDLLDKYGCNAWSALDSFNNGTTTGSVINDSSLNTFLNNDYYNSLNSDIKDKIIKSDFDIGPATSGKTRDEINVLSSSVKWNGYVGTLSLADAMNASVSSSTISNDKISTSNYLTSLSTTTLEYIWTLTAANTNTYDLYTIVSKSQIALRRAGRINQVSEGNTAILYAYPVFYLSSNVSYKGTGTSVNPFIIS